MADTEKTHNASPLEEILQQRIMLMDGAMATMVQKYQLTEQDYRGERFAEHPAKLKGNYDLLNLTHPDIITAIHRDFIEAGADIIETNTFNSTGIVMAKYQMEGLIYELNRAGADIARTVVNEYTNLNKPLYVAGVLGPTSDSLSLSQLIKRPGSMNINYQELVDAYLETIRGLVDGGVDLLLLETIFDTLNAKAAISAIEQYFNEHDIRLPIMLSGTITDSSGRNLIGQTTEAFWNSVKHAKPLIVGLNCGFGATDLRQPIEKLSQIADTYISVHPNAGLPNLGGGYDDTPEFMADLLQEYAKSGLVNIIGGCCGTTPEHIRAIASSIKDIPPRQLP